MSITKLEPRQKEPRRVIAAVPVEVQIDPKDTRNCFAESWENRRGAPGRCPGISTILDSDDLECRFFSHSTVTQSSIYTDPNTILRTSDRDVAHWGQKTPIRRCNACIVGEQVMKQAQK